MIVHTKFKVLVRAWALSLSLAVVSVAGVSTSAFAQTAALPRFSLHATVVLIVGYALHFTPRDWTFRARAFISGLPAPVLGALLVGVGWACLAWGPGDTLAFIYHDF